MLTLDRNSHVTGSRGFAWLRNLPVPDFPFKFKTSSSYELDPKRNYLFCCYPHGLLPVGVVLPFLFEKCGFKNVFPNHKPYLTTMPESYYFPYFREMLLAFNCCSASEKSLNYLLSDKNAGNAVALIVGVPVFSFGVNSVYKYPQNKFLDWIKTVTGINLKLSYGQGFFHNWYGIVPFINPVNTIVGEPIDVKRNDNPTREEVEELHKKFTNALIKLFDDHKHLYEEDDIKLVIIE
ncbi:hypothetical protein FQR65_LT07172 [Abscondita terminalis]|nr:hypothetical protein FQR65_LT07172 [Abscondita terminalis]